GAHLALHSFPTRRSSDLSKIRSERKCSVRDPRRRDRQTVWRSRFGSFRRAQNPWHSLHFDMRIATYSERKNDTSARLDRPSPLEIGKHTSELQSPCNLVC